MTPIIDDKLNDTLERTVKNELDDRTRIVNNIDVFKKECREMEKEYTCDISVFLESVDAFDHTFLTNGIPMITNIERTEHRNRPLYDDIMYNESIIYRFEFNFIKSPPETVVINKKMVNSFECFIELYNRSLMRKLSTGYYSIDAVNFASEACFEFFYEQVDCIDFSSIKSSALFINDIQSPNDNMTKINSVKLPARKDLSSVRISNGIDIVNMDKILQENPEVDISLVLGSIFE